MKLSHRFIYYFSGFAIGIIFLIFFLSGKETSCDYGPDARTLKTIRITKHIYSDQAARFFREHNMDTTMIAHILNTGDVDFSKSKVHEDSCNMYTIYGDYKEAHLELTIERCDSISTIKEIKTLN